MPSKKSGWRILMTSVEGDNNVNDNGHVKEKEPIILAHDNVDDNDVGGDYINLRTGPNDSQPDHANVPSPPPLPPPPPPPSPPSFWYWFRFGMLVLCIGVIGIAVFNWVGPFFIQKVFIPIINWQRNRFTSSEVAVMVFASIALFPTILLPSSPSMWFAGLTFGYLYGFLIVMSGVAVGVSIPFFIGSIFHENIKEWLDQYPDKASVLRSAGGGNWFQQFQAILLIRISPFPYIIFNYCAVATNVQYGPYLLASLIGMLPDVIASIYTGILIRALANVSHKTHTLSAPQIVFNVVGFCIAIATTMFCTFYAKRRIKELQKEDKLLLKL